MVKKVSIIVPIYNTEKFLSHCIDSLIAQSFKNLEIILVDDGSTDDSSTICDKYAMYDNRIKVIHKSNGGQSSARNVGLDVATGEYVSFVDSDDFITNNFIKSLVDGLEKNNADFSICKCRAVDENGEILKPYKLIIDKDVIPQEKFFDYVYQQGGWQFIIPCNKLFKIQIFNGLRFEEGKIYEDEIIISQIVRKTNIIACIDEEMYFYTCRQGSTVQSGYRIERLNIVDCFIDRLNFLKEKKDYKNYKVTQYLITDLFCEAINKADFNIQDNCEKFIYGFSKIKKYCKYRFCYYKLVLKVLKNKKLRKLIL